jgi:hypothetical protein
MFSFSSENSLDDIACFWAGAVGVEVPDPFLDSDRTFFGFLVLSSFSMNLRFYVVGLVVVS